jgi:4-amino-4-deoxy-L-arabinose transferase-like glycosyltransferase
VIVLGLAIRVVGLDRVPPEPYMDETSVACESYSLALTGHDLWGARWPVIFRALDDYKHPLYLYAAAASTSTLGLNILAVRLPAALLGALTLLLVALLAREVDPDEPRAAPFAAFVLAVMPWHVQYSRMAWEAVTMVLTFTLAAWLFLRAARLGGARPYALAGAALGLCVYSYTPAKLLAPAFLALEVGLALRGRERRARLAEVAALVVAAALVALPMAWVQLLHREEINRRFGLVSVFREASPLGAAARSYVSHLSPVFLFVSGDASPRHAMPGFGECLLATAPLCAIGLLRAASARSRADLLLLGWLAIYPLGGALTSLDVPHASRAILAAPLFALLAARGAGVVVSRLGRRRAAWAALAFVVATNGALFLLAYERDYATESARAWWRGKGALIRAAADMLRDGRARRVIVAAGAGVREDVLFHTGFDPRRTEWPDPRWQWIRSSDDALAVLKTLGRDEVLLCATDQVHDSSIVPEQVEPLPGEGPSPALYRGLRAR